MARSCKSPGVSSQNPLGAFRAPPLALRDFNFLKIVDALYGLCPF